MGRGGEQEREGVGAACGGSWAGVDAGFREWHPRGPHVLFTPVDWAAGETGLCPGGGWARAKVLYPPFGVSHGGDGKVNGSNIDLYLFGPR